MSECGEVRASARTGRGVKRLVASFPGGSPKGSQLRNKPGGLITPRMIRRTAWLPRHAGSGPAVDPHSQPSMRGSGPPVPAVYWYKACGAMVAP